MSWFYAGAAGIGRRIREDRESYENYLRSLEPKRQKLIEGGYSQESITSLIENDPEGVLAIIYNEAVCGRINADRENRAWKAILEALPRLKREDLTKESELMIADVYLKRHASFLEVLSYEFLLPLRILFTPPGLFKRGCCRSNKKLAKKYLGIG